MKKINLFNRFVSVACIVLLSFGMTGCNEETKTVHNTEVHHVVFCWLKDTNDMRLKSKIIEESYGLQKIPGIIQFKVGKSLKSHRDIVDDSFDFAIYMTFDSKDAMDRYIDHPVHKKFVSQLLKPVLNKVLVYDFIN